MEPVYSIAELGNSYLRLTFQEWLDLPEPVFFNFVAVQEENHWLFLEHAPSLSALSTRVTLIRVGETFYKVDGKQRKAVWTSNKIEPPELLIAQVFEMSEADFAAVNEDARSKQMKLLPTNEVVKLFYDELGLVFKSDRLRSGFITEAISIALRGRQRALQDKRTDREKEDIDMKKAIQVFSRELAFIDSINANPGIFVTGVLAGALIILGINKSAQSGPNTSEAFFDRLNKEDGKEDGDLRDPISLLLKSIAAFKQSPKISVPKMSIDLCKKTIQAIESWAEGTESPKYWRKREFTGIDHMPFVHELKRIKKISDEMDL